MKILTDIFCADYYRMTGEACRPGLRFFINRFLHHNVAYMYWFRKYQNNKGLFSRIMLFRLSRKYGLEISTNAAIGPGLYLGHAHNITVGDDVILGRNVNLHKGCTVGRTNRNCAGSPTIGDNVFIGINATVVGNVTIGNDVLIAPNSYVNFDVPDHSVVIGNPGIIHYKENATASYVNFQVEGPT